MARTIFAAGATGAVGRRLVTLLQAEGWRVVGMARDDAAAARLAGMGVEAALADAYDAGAVLRAVEGARPMVVMHQLTDLPAGLDPALMDAAALRNARLRDEGTRNLVAAALAAGVGRLVAQSVAFAYAEGKRPYREGDRLAVDAPGRAGVSARGVASLEAQVLGAGPPGLVLRYGRLYGPGTGFDAPPGPAPVHVDAAAWAACLAARSGEAGRYNIAEDDGTVDSERARRLLGWADTWRAGESGGGPC